MVATQTHTCKSALQTRRRSCALKSGCHGSGRPEVGPTVSQWLPASNGASLSGWPALQQRVLGRRVLLDAPRQHRCGCDAGLRAGQQNLALLKMHVTLRPRSTQQPEWGSLHLRQQTVDTALSRNAPQVPLPSAPKAGIQAQAELPSACFQQSTHWFPNSSCFVND